MAAKHKKFLLTSVGVLISVIPAVIATLSYFPLWKSAGGEYLLSGFTLILLFLSAIPLGRIILAKLKTPAAYVIWLSVFLLFFALEKIASEMTVISFVGFISNLIGAVFFKLAERVGNEEQ